MVAVRKLHPQATLKMDVPFLFEIMLLGCYKIEGRLVPFERDVYLKRYFREMKLPIHVVVVTD